MEIQEIKKCVEKFKAERIKNVRDFNLFPIPLDKTASFFIHIMPYSFIKDELLYLTRAKNMGLNLLMKPIGDFSGWNKIFNF